NCETERSLVRCGGGGLFICNRRAAFRGGGFGTAGCRCQRRSLARRRGQTFARYFSPCLIWVKAVQRPQRANGVSRREMIFIGSIVIDAVMFEGAGQTARERLPAWRLVDKFSGGHDADQITGQLFGSLALDPQSRPGRGAAADRPKQKSQGI